MNNTKTIFKSLLIMIVAISLFTVSCSKDEGGTTTPTTPKPITITGASITSAFTGLGTITIGKMDFDFTQFDGNTASLTKNGTGVSTGGEDTLTKEGIEKKFNDGLKGKVSGATVDANVTTATFPAIDSTTEIAVTITITPNTGNSFAAENDLKPYTKDASKNTVTVTLTLKPESTKKWNGVN